MSDGRYVLRCRIEGGIGTEEDWCELRRLAEGPDFGLGWDAMPSSPTFGRKLPFPRNGLWHERGHSRQSSCSPRAWLRVLYGLIAILLVAVVLLSHRQQAAIRPNVPLGCGAVEDTLRSLIFLPARKKVVQLGAAEDTVYSGQLRNELLSRGINQDVSDIDVQKGESRPKVLAFVGIQTGFGSAERRRALRQTWMPSNPEGIVRLEEETGLALRFVIGYTSNAIAAAELEREIETYRDFLRIDNEEEYARLPFKTLAFFKAAHMLFDADFYVKVDDDIYLRPDRLSLLLKKKRDTTRTYLGCMKKGNVITNNAFKWYEPLAFLLGSEYFVHAWGPIYALSRDIVADLSNFRNDSLRMFSNEDVTIGSWMLAFNVHHEDDRTLCQGECQVDSIAVWDIPACSAKRNRGDSILDTRRVNYVDPSLMVATHCCLSQVFAILNKNFYNFISKTSAQRVQLLKGENYRALRGG